MSTLAKIEKATENLSFYLAITITLEQQQVQAYEVNVQAVEELINAPQAPPQTAAEREIKIRDDLCAAFTSANSGRELVTFVLTTSGRIGTKPAKRKELLPSLYHGAISLNSLLYRWRTLTLRDRSVSLKDRMILAFRVASNFLQLLRSEWTPGVWSKAIIYFPLRPEDPTTGAEDPITRPDIPPVDFTRPFVSATFGNTPKQKYPTQHYPRPKEDLLELGILLLEIWHMTAFKSRFDLKGMPVGYYSRLSLALEWLDDTDDPLLKLYDKAVNFCLTGLRTSEERNAQWDNLRLWAAAYANIVEPLSENCKMWRESAKASL